MCNEERRREKSNRSAGENKISSHTINFWCWDWLIIKHQRFKLFLLNFYSNFVLGKKNHRNDLVVESIGSKMVELSFLMHFHSYKLMFFFFSFSPVHVFCHHRKSLHWTAFTGWYTFMHFTCRGSTRGVGLVQCIAFGNCTERTTSFTRCKSSIVQHYWRIEAHRLAESSCWKRTGNLFYGITQKKTAQ